MYAAGHNLLGAETSVREWRQDAAVGRKRGRAALLKAAEAVATGSADVWPSIAAPAASGPDSTAAACAEGPSGTTACSGAATPGGTAPDALDCAAVEADTAPTVGPVHGPLEALGTTVMQESRISGRRRAAEVQVLLDTALPQRAGDVLGRSTLQLTSSGARGSVAAEDRIAIAAKLQGTQDWQTVSNPSVQVCTTNSLTQAA
jgi:hypothetical protein